MKSQNTTNDPHVYAKSEFIIQHNVVTGPACCWASKSTDDRAR